MGFDEGKIYDTIIIGSGPAGLSAGVYAKRACLDCILLENVEGSGGQITYSSKIDNYLGIEGIDGYSLSKKFRDHALNLGLDIISENVDLIDDPFSRVKILKTANGEYKTRTIVLATGARTRKLNVPGEEELTGLGVCICATCDGAFYRDKVVCVVGGGDTAAGDAIFLSKICSKVYLIHRRGELRAVKALQADLQNKENIEIIWDTVIERINGENCVESIDIRNIKREQCSKLRVNAVFLATGMIPESSLVKGICELDKRAYVLASENCKTTVPGIFVAGDVRTKYLRQVITAAADGASSIKAVSEYLESVI